jgi:lipopolysaccharide transport system ATP-binding protein
MSHSTHVAVRTQGLSKRYRIGAAEQRHETIVGSIGAMVQAPFTNWRDVRRLSRFQSGDEADLVWAVKDVSFDVHDGEVVGIIGRNGAGKSTLLKILCRITEPTSGRAEIVGRIGSLLEVGTGFHPDLTGRENVYVNGTILGMRKREIDERFEEIVEFAEVARFIDTPVKRYSSGMRVRLAFAVAAHLQPEILIVDEVLAVGDIEFQRKCLGKMSDVARQGRTVLFVSHNMEAVRLLCSRGIVLKEGQVAYDGSAEDATELLFGMASPGEDGSRHVIQGSQATSGTVVTRIEVLDLEGNSKPVLATWDSVRFRVHYRSDETYSRGSFVIMVRDRRDQRLVRMDSATATPIRAGEHAVDCVIDRFPLAAGDYTIGVSLKRAGGSVIWGDKRIGTLIVYGRDVFAAGRAPTSDQALFAVENTWTTSGP